MNFVEYMPAPLRKVLAYKLYAPPDGGIIGGLVVFATFIAFAVIIGLESVYGLLMAAMLEEENTPFTRAGLSWAQSAAIFLELALGIVTGTLVTKIGARLTCLLGTGLLTLGMFLASAATNEIIFCLAYSVLGGSGMALSYGAASIAVSQYFTTKSAFANAFAGTGIGVGTIVLALVIEHSIELFGWRGCMRLLAVITAVCVGLASLAYVPIVDEDEALEALQQAAEDAQEGKAVQSPQTSGHAGALHWSESEGTELTSSQAGLAGGFDTGLLNPTTAAGGHAHGGEIEGGAGSMDGGSPAVTVDSPAAKSGGAGSATHTTMMASMRARTVDAPGLGSPLTALKVLRGNTGTAVEEQQSTEQASAAAAAHAQRVSPKMKGSPGIRTLTGVIGHGQGHAPAGHGQGQETGAASGAGSMPSPLRMSMPSSQQASGAIPRLNSDGSITSHDVPDDHSMGSPVSSSLSARLSARPSGPTGPASAHSTPSMRPAVAPGQSRAASEPVGASGTRPPNLRLSGVSRMRAGTGSSASPWVGATTPSLQALKGVPGSALLSGHVGLDLSLAPMTPALGGVGSAPGGEGLGGQTSTGAGAGKEEQAYAPSAPSLPLSARSPALSAVRAAGALGSPRTGPHALPLPHGAARHATLPHSFHAQRMSRSAYMGPKATPPISPWLLAGGQGSAGSIVPQMSLKHSGLASLVRALEQQKVEESAASAQAAASGAAIALDMPFPTSAAEGLPAGVTVAHVEVEEEEDEAEGGTGAKTPLTPALGGRKPHSAQNTPAFGAAASRSATVVEKLQHGRDGAQVTSERRGTQADAGVVGPQSGPLADGGEEEEQEVGPCCAAFATLLVKLRLLKAGPDGKPQPSPSARVWLDGRFWAIALAMALIISAMTVPETHLATFVATDMGLGNAEASRLFAVMGVAGIVGRLLFGSLTLYYHVDLQFLLQSCGVATGLCMAGLAVFGGSPAYLTLFAIVFGGVGGSTYGFVSPILVDYFGLQGLPAALGGTYTVRAPAVLLFSPIAGWVREATGSYTSVFFVCGVLCVVSALPIGVLHCECRRHALHQAVQDAVAVEAQGTTKRTAGQEEQA